MSGWLHQERIRFLGVDEQGRIVFRPGQSQWFLDNVALETMVDRVVALDDPRLAPVYSTSPIVLGGPPNHNADGSVEEFVDAAVELIDVMLLLHENAITTTPIWAWVERRNGVLGLVVPAPVRGPGLHAGFRKSTLPIHRAAQTAMFWLRDRLQKHQLAPKVRKALCKDAKTTNAQFRVLASAIRKVRPEAIPKLKALEERVLRAKPVSPHLDFDRAIELGETTYADMVAHGRSEWDAPYVEWPLAAAYHHRACVRWQKGDRDDALRDLDRCLELDPHAQYLTTRALFAEQLGDPGAAEFHDRAVAAVDPPGTFRDPRPRRARDRARTFTARAAFRAKHGDLEGAAEDRKVAASPLP